MSCIVSRRTALKPYTPQARGGEGRYRVGTERSANVPQLPGSRPWSYLTGTGRGGHRTKHWAMFGIVLGLKERNPHFGLILDHNRHGRLQSHTAVNILKQPRECVHLVGTDWVCAAEHHLRGLTGSRKLWGVKFGPTFCHGRANTLSPSFCGTTALLALMAPSVFGDRPGPSLSTANDTPRAMAPPGLHVAT